MPRLYHDGTPWMTCDHDCHLRRRSLGGEDWALRVGEPIRAPFDGTFRYHRAGTGGYTFTGIPADARLRGMVTQAMHNSRANGLLLGGDAKYVREGHILGWSGGAVGHPGSGSSTGPHTHQHGILNGVRVAMTNAVQWMRARTGAALSGEETEIDMPLTDDEIKRIAREVWAGFAIGHAGLDSSTNAATHLSFGRRDAGRAAAAAEAALDAAVRAEQAALAVQAALSKLDGAPHASPPAVVGGTITMTGTITPEE